MPRCRSSGSNSRSSRGIVDMRAEADIDEDTIETRRSDPPPSRRRRPLHRLTKVLSW
jgi:hypothetical protein